MHELCAGRTRPPVRSHVARSGDDLRHDDRCRSLRENNSRRRAFRAEQVPRARRRDTCADMNARPNVRHIAGGQALTRVSKHCRPVPWGLPGHSGDLSQPARSRLA
jgi:hypothetical protein